MATQAHILLLTHSYSPEDTAPQRRWSAFIQELIAAGYHVTVVAPEPRQNHSRWATERGEHGERIVRVPGAQASTTRTGRLVNNVLGSLASVPRGLLVKKVDLVIATVPALTTAPVGLLVAKLKQVPFVLEMRDAWPDLAHDAQLPQNLLRKSMEVVLEYCQKSADTVITVTEGFARALQSRGVQTAACVANGLTNLNMVASEHPGSLRQPQLQVLYVGNHGESQGLETICAAAALAADHVQVTMVGEGTQKRALERYAQSLNAPVKFVDHVSAGDLGHFYDNADTCVVSLRPDWPSFQWTIPSKTYELLGVGRRLTAVLLGEAAELVRQSQPDSVVAADPRAIADYWIRLATNPEELVVQTSQEVLRDYLPAQRVGPLRSILERLLEKPQKSSVKYTQSY